MSKANDREKIAKRRKRRRRRRLKTSVKITLALLLCITATGAYIGILHYRAIHAPDPYGQLTNMEDVSDNAYYDLSEEVKLSAEYWILDVGNGEAIYVQCGQTDILIDTGIKENGKAVKNAIEGEINGELDYLIITNTDERRIGGLKTICKDLKPEKILTCPLGTKAVEIKRAVGNIPMEEVGDTTLNLDENGTFTIFRPDVISEDENDQSLMTLFRYGEVTFFAESDAGELEEVRVVKQVGKSDVVVLARGGSDKVNQHIASLDAAVYVASQGKGAHLSPAILDTIGKPFYSTNVSGTIKFSTTGERYESNLDERDRITPEQ